MNELTVHNFKQKLNEWGKSKLPFFFVVDFEMEKPQAWLLSEMPAKQILFNFEGFTNAGIGYVPTVFIDKAPEPLESYQSKFDVVHRHIQLGNSFLVNLTSKTQIHTTASLTDIFYASSAKYRICFEDRWVVFSPETFIRINDGVMRTCPMKGTIDASLPNAAETLLNDSKELAEHVTVVDLLRNDLSRFCTDVTVEKFRFTEKIQTLTKDLIQTSSTITGRLPVGYHAHIGDILAAMLPAGSVSGAPKPKTCEIILEAEGEKRGYYTGVAGYFDGTNLDSCVLIRFIEQQNGRLFYRSGGGITAQSIPWQEYQELIDKVYVPATGVHQNIS